MCVFQLFLVVPNFIVSCVSISLSPPSVVISYESVVSELEADTVDTAASLGIEGGRFSPGPVSQAVFIHIKVLK